MVDFEGNVLEGEGRAPIETPITARSTRRVRTSIRAPLPHGARIAFTLMKDVTLAPMRARAVRWQSGIPTSPDPIHIKLKEQGVGLGRAISVPTRRFSCAPWVDARANPYPRYCGRGVISTRTRAR